MKVIYTDKYAGGCHPIFKDGSRPMIARVLQSNAATDTGLAEALSNSSTVTS